VPATGGHDHGPGGEMDELPLSDVEGESAGHHALPEEQVDEHDVFEQIHANPTGLLQENVHQPESAGEDRPLLRERDLEAPIDHLLQASRRLANVVLHELLVVEKEPLRDDVVEDLFLAVLGRAGLPQPREALAVQGEVRSGHRAGTAAGEGPLAQESHSRPALPGSDGRTEASASPSHDQHVRFDRSRCHGFSLHARVPDAWVGRGFV